MGDLMVLLRGRQQGKYHAMAIDLAQKVAQLTQLNDNQAATIAQLQKELAHQKAWFAEVQGQCEILRDAWEHQKTLTHNALVEGRNVFDELYDLRGRVHGAESSAADWKRMYYGAVAKPPAVIP